MKMKPDAIRQALIDGTIHVIARDGLDGATTKQISKKTGINEAYIYRRFADKEDMFVQTFSQLDKELVAKVLEYVSVMHMHDLKEEERCWILFTAMWRCLLSSSDKCICYMQYYYSPYFRKYSAEEHRSIYRPVLEAFTPAFREGTNVWPLLNYMLDVLFASAIKVFAGELANDDKTAAHVFDLIYGAVEPHLVWSEKLA